MIRERKVRIEKACKAFRREMILTLAHGDEVNFIKKAISTKQFD
jgi:hypothetical protein